VKEEVDFWTVAVVSSIHMINHIKKIIHW